jgi:transposase InsO family protein
MQRRSQADGANRFWVADLTYGPTRAEFVYLAVVLDVWGRRGVGWSMSERLKATQSCDDWEMVNRRRVYRRRKPAAGSLRIPIVGYKHACRSHQALLEQYRMTASMSADQQPLPMPSTQHVEIDPDMRVRKVRLEQHRFTGCLDARENERFHS